MDGPVIRGAALLGVLLLALPAAAVEMGHVFFASGYRYAPAAQEVDPAKAEIGMALCGTRCNALSGDYWSYMETMTWRLTKVEGVTERVVELNNPFLNGRCVCTGEEFRVEYFFYRPGVTPGAEAMGAEEQAESAKSGPQE